MAVAIAGCGGGGAPVSDPQAVADTATNAAHAVADRDGDKACGYLTADAQRQAQLQVGAGVLGQIDCKTLVERATAFFSPLDKSRIKSLQATNVVVNGTTASTTLAGQGMSVQLSLQKTSDGWKIAGFANAVGVPGG